MLKSIWSDKRKRITLIAAISAVALVVAGVGGWFAWTAHAVSVAQDDCAQAVKTVEGVKAEYVKLVSGDAKTASGITAEQVKDAATVETLATELKASEPESVTCPVKDAKSLKDATVKLNTQTEWYKTHKESLNKAVKNVNQSKLDKVIDDANALLADSDGKVQDNAVRDELSKAIEAKDEQAINDATTKVNDSIAAKTKADEEARAQAEAEAAAQAAAEAAAQAAAAQTYTPSYSSGYSNSYSNSGYSSGSSSSSGSTSSGSSSSGSSSGKIEDRSSGYGTDGSKPLVETYVH